MKIKPFRREDHFFFWISTYFSEVYSVHRNYKGSFSSKWKIIEKSSCHLFGVWWLLSSRDLFFPLFSCWGWWPFHIPLLIFYQLMSQSAQRIKQMQTWVWRFLFFNFLNLFFQLFLHISFFLVHLFHLLYLQRLSALCNIFVLLQGLFYLLKLFAVFFQSF